MSALVFAHHRISPLAERLKDAAAVAFIALLLGIPMIGLTTASIRAARCSIADPLAGAAGLHRRVLRAVACCCVTASIR
jgi:hypothetical protein